MKTLKELLTYPSMWRTSHGFGVHSPFAFHFITRVIGERKAAYYAYPEIIAFCPKSRRAGFNEIFAGRDMSIPEALLIFRILCHFNPREVIEIGNGHEVTNVILRNAVPKAIVSTFHSSAPPHMQKPDAEPVVIANQCSNDEAAEVERFIGDIVESHDAILVMRNLRSVEAFAGIWERITAATGFGMAFTDGYTGIFVARRKLPKSIYKVLM